MHKIGKKALALSLSAVLALGAMPFTAVSAAERTYREQELDAYLYNNENKETIKCLFFEDMPNVPYIDVKDYLEIIAAQPFTVAESGSGVYTVTGKEGKTMVIDAEKNTVHFDEFETFMPNNPADADGDGPEAPYMKNLHVVYDSDPKPVDLDFGKYQIDIAPINHTAYFPLTTLADLFADTYLSALYLDGSIYFFDPMNSPYFDRTSAYSVKPREKDLIAYTYNELCFMFDRLYGRPPKSQLGKSLAENSFDEIMTSTEIGKNVKPLLLSESMIDFYTGLVLLDIMADDGGHTQLSDPFSAVVIDDKQTEFTAAVNQLLKEADNDKAAVIAARITNIHAIVDESRALKKLRTDALAKYEVVKEWEKDSEDKEVFAELVMSGDTAVFVFDSFEDEVVPAFKWSLDCAAERGAKNFLIDLSCNTGGSSAVLGYMLSVMTGKSDLHMNSTISGSSYRQTGSVDKNLDGVVDAKDDEVNYNLRFALLTSKFSYSCANYLPCLAQEKQIPVIGETSGGGTCMLLNMSYPSLASYSVSGYKTMLYDNGGDVDAGAKVNLETVAYTADNKSDYSKLYDFSAVSTFLDEYYAKTTPVKATESRAASSDSAKGSMSPGVIIAISACAVLAVAVLILVLFLRRKKRKQ